jgi:tetratricopeptide (TPR) repeat protein
LEPENPLVFAQRGTAWEALENLDNALADYSRAVELDPGLVMLYYNRALLRMDREDHEGVIADTSQVIASYPDFDGPYLTRAQAYLNIENFEHALADAHKAHEINPEDGRGLFYMGLAAYYLMRYNEAAEFLTQSIELLSDPAAAYYYRGLVYLESDQPELGEADLRSAAENGLLEAHDALEMLHSEPPR